MACPSCAEMSGGELSDRYGAAEECRERADKRIPDHGSNRAVLLKHYHLPWQHSSVREPARYWQNDAWGPHQKLHTSPQAVRNRIIQLSPGTAPGDPA